MLLALRPSAFLIAALAGLTSANPQLNTVTADEVAHIRDFFYTGGQYVDDGNGGHVFSDQMYVEHLHPVGSVVLKQKYPIVMMHGQAQTGTNWLNKPDGGRGWASLFLSQGYEVYIIDQTFRGRSAWKPGAPSGTTKPSTYSAEIIQQRFTAPEKYMLWPQAANHTQWPGTGVMGDPIFDTFYSSNVQFISNATYQQSTVQAAGAALMDRIGTEVILMGHSQGGLLPILLADVRPHLTKGLILLEPTGPPFREAVFNKASARPYGLTDTPIMFDPEVRDPAVDLVKQTYPAQGSGTAECILQAETPAPKQLVNLASKPILVLTTEASYHAVYDYCTVEFLRQAGCSKTEHLELAKVGVRGNGHLVFMERNSDQVQMLLHKWISKLC
ncbi:Alpha/beta hydrolase family-domain-containing protein [Diplogelasinospora grovesii]|uniref:Alpha/beta hydrolase family-domain-containing protein n=1 Tax=Diplogelasinospora grovesii TaxID=303347 RepID=A0AAN6MVE6_9PEZI|nr:Alpha/beta hydrolase family-domain-containing protein [Diplogelasinospora grovesii]